MNNNYIVFNLENVLIRDGFLNKNALKLLKMFVLIGWKVYIQSEEGKTTAVEFIKAKKLEEVVGLNMWDSRYNFDIAVTHEHQTGPIHYPVPSLNTSFFLQL